MRHRRVQAVVTRAVPDRAQSFVVVFVCSAVYYTVDVPGDLWITPDRSLRQSKENPPQILNRKGCTKTAPSDRSIQAGWYVQGIMNESLTVRITRSAHAALRSLAEEADESMTETLDKAIEAYRRASFLAGLNGDFAALRQNRAAWEEEQQERRAWDATLADGLEE